MKTITTISICALLVLVTATPETQTADSDALTVEFLKSLLGKDHLDDATAELHKRAGGDPLATYFVTHEKSFFHSWKNKGLSVRFDGTNRATAIFLYSKGVDKFAQFAAGLPENLSFDDTRDQVEKKLGKAAREHRGGFGVMPRSEYPSKGIMIDWTIEKPNRIACVIIRRDISD